MSTNKEKGFSLIETLIAMFVLGVGALALAQLFTSAVWINARTKDDTQLATVGQKYVERLYQQGYEVLDAGAGGSLTTAVSGYSVLDVRVEDSAAVSNANNFHQNEVRYDIYWEIARCGNATPTDACTNTQKLIGQPWVEISVRVVDNRLQRQEWGSREREVTLRIQVTRSI